MLRNFRNHLGKGRFGRNVFTVMSGTVAAQMISILFAPLLTRIIPPEEFGKFALFTSINLIFLATVCGQYENAIQLPQKNEDAEKILQGALRIALLASSLVALAVVIAFMAGWGPFTQNAFLLLPITLILGGLQQVLIQWVNRQKIFRLTSAARVTQALTNSGLNLFLGWLGWGMKGLCVSLVISNAISCLIMSQSLKGMRIYSRKELKPILKTYLHFPLYTLPSELINAGASQLPVFFLGHFFGDRILGFYSLTQRILNLPSMVLSTAVSEVFRQRASADYARLKNCSEIYKKTFKSLVLIGIGPFLIFLLLSPELFAFVFGSTWRYSGELAQVMALLFFCRFIISPLSSLYYIAGKQKEDFILHGWMAVSTAAVMYFGGQIFSEPKHLVLAYVLNYASIYSIYLVRSRTFSKGMVLGSKVAI